MADGSRRQVVPPPFMLPPPNPSESRRSSSSSSSRKRRRADNLDSISRASSGASSDFTTAVKKRVEIIDDATSCWHCGASPTDICHVIGKKDRMFPEIVQQGLITFDHLGHIDNAIPLCPLCHRNFDDINKPGLIFLPFLPYFIDFERQNFTQREKVARETRSIPPRTCPTPQTYREYLISTGQLSQENSHWGLYWRYTLRCFFPNLGQDSSWIPGLGPFQEPDSWHGAPMAAIWRGFLILGNPLCGLPADQIKLLEELRDLYKRRISLDDLRPSIILDVQGSDTPHYISAQAMTSSVMQPNSTSRIPTLDFDVPEAAEAGDSRETHTDSGVDVVSQRSRSSQRYISYNGRLNLDSEPKNRFCSSAVDQITQTPFPSFPKTCTQSRIRTYPAQMLPKSRKRRRLSPLDDSYEDCYPGAQLDSKHKAFVHTVEQWIQRCTAESVAL